MEHIFAESTNEEILGFISMFQSKETITIFTQGMCYWFAVILSNRFPDGEIYYDQIDGHFVTRICNKYYDVTGEITPTNGTYAWAKIDDDMLKQRILSQVILKNRKV